MPDKDSPEYIQIHKNAEKEVAKNWLWEHRRIYKANGNISPDFEAEVALMVEKDLQKREAEENRVAEAEERGL